MTFSRILSMVLGGAALAALAAGPGLAQNAASSVDNDRHAGYYYPEPGSQEVYGARAETMPQASRGIRLGFVTGFTAKQLEATYPPPYVMFAKGTEITFIGRRSAKASERVVKALRVRIKGKNYDLYPNML